MRTRTDKSGADEWTSSVRGPRSRRSPGPSRRIAVAVAMCLAMLVGLPSTASAHGAAGHWSDNHQLCVSSSSCLHSGYIVRAWQTILRHFVVDHGQNGSWFRYGCWFVDGSYGPNTANATKELQGKLGLAKDGWVGPNTWTRMYDRLSRATRLDTSGWIGYELVGYQGVGPVLFHKGRSTGSWMFYDDCAGIWRLMNH